MGSMALPFSDRGDIGYAQQSMYGQRAKREGGELGYRGTRMSP